MGIHKNEIKFQQTDKYLSVYKNLPTQKLSNSTIFIDF